MTLEDALKISTTLAQIDRLLTTLDDQLQEADCSATHRMMVGNARQALSVLTDTLRPLSPTQE